MITKEQLAEWESHGAKHCLVGAGVMLALIAEVRRLRAMAEARHTCAIPGDTAKDIASVAYDLRCAGCVALRIQLEGPMLDVSPTLAEVTRERDALREVVEAARLVHKYACEQCTPSVRLGDALAKLDEVKPNG